MINKLVSVIIMLSKFETLPGIMCSATQWHETIVVVNYNVAGYNWTLRPYSLDPLYMPK